MSDEAPFPHKDGIAVRRIMMIGATKGGEHVGIEFETTSNETAVLLIPFGLFQRLMLGLMTAGGIAHQGQLLQKGSKENVLAFTGFSAFRPTGHEVGRGRTIQGEDLVLTRFKKGELPIIDVTMSPIDAKYLAKNILAQFDAERPTRRKH